MLAAVLALASSVLVVSAQEPNYWLSFGDSYTQTGFNITGDLPSVENPIGNPPYPGWSATGGADWIGYATVEFNHSLVFTYNFAYGGATIDRDLVQPFEPTVVTMEEQVQIFLDSVADKPASTPWTSENALFSFWIGINDIGNSYYSGGDRDAFSDTLLDAYFGLVQSLYDVGARNFLFINVPPIQRSPLMLAQSEDAQALEQTVIEGFNGKLVDRAASLEADNAGVTTWIYDSNAAFNEILDDPIAFGFRDATTYGADEDLFWGNNYHPSTYAHRYFGEDVGQLLEGTVW